MYMSQLTGFDDRTGCVCKLHGKKFGGCARPTRRTDALNTRSCTTSVWSSSSTNLGEPLPQTRRAVTRNIWASRSLASFVISLG